jgi:hypothetical protein
MKFIMVMASVAVVGFFITLKPCIDLLNIIGEPLLPRLIINALDLVTITVPPALPTSL